MTKFIELINVRRKKTNSSSQKYLGNKFYKKDKTIIVPH